MDKQKQSKIFDIIGLYMLMLFCMFISTKCIFAALELLQSFYAVASIVFMALAIWIAIEITQLAYELLKEDK